jgi:hypothetical protein
MEPMVVPRPVATIVGIVVGDLRRVNERRPNYFWTNSGPANRRESAGYIGKKMLPWADDDVIIPTSSPSSSEFRLLDGHPDPRAAGYPLRAI